MQDLLNSAGFAYHEANVVERLATHLRTEKESETSLAYRLFYLAQAANEWYGKKDLFLTILPHCPNQLTIVSRYGEAIAHLKLDLLMPNT